jgi:hypothetical protein
MTMRNPVRHLDHLARETASLVLGRSLQLSRSADHVHGSTAVEVVRFESGRTPMAQTTNFSIRWRQIVRCPPLGRFSEQG